MAEWCSACCSVRNTRRGCSAHHGRGHARSLFGVIDLLSILPTLLMLLFPELALSALTITRLCGCLRIFRFSNWDAYIAETQIIPHRPAPDRQNHRYS